MQTQDLVRVITGEVPDEAAKVFDGIFDAVVTRANAAGIYFKIADFSPAIELGPAPYPRPLQTAGADVHSHDIAVASQFPVGTAVVVAFVGGSAHRPRVIG